MRRMCAAAGAGRFSALTKVNTNSLSPAVVTRACQMGLVPALRQCAIVRHGDLIGAARVDRQLIIGWYADGL